MKALYLFDKNTLKCRSEEKYLFVFLSSFIAAMIVFLPIMILSRGMFIYYGDFNLQQIIFNDHVQKAVKDGALGWDWSIDLGGNYIESYSFYLLGSPFFWLMTLFPRGSVPYLIPWVLALKTAIASVTSYAYIRRFVDSREASAIGAFLYAFSGFQIHNVFFNHFHDVTAFFPLMLLALELNVQEDRRGVFAITVGLMAAINYFFFAGQVTFLVIYFICRCLSKDFKITFKKFLLLALESIIGVMLSAAILLPAVISVLGNPRVGSTMLGAGVDAVIYTDRFKIIRLIQAFFILPEPTLTNNIFGEPEPSYNWASVAGYLPMFSMTGVIAFMRSKKGHWAKRIIAVCTLFACIPILNSSFYMFNAEYYARWLYMPILIMTMMTAYVVDNHFSGKEKDLSIKNGILPVIAVICAIIVIAIMPTKTEDGKLKFFSTAESYELFCIQMGVTAGFLLLMIWFIYSKRAAERRYSLLNIMVIGACSLSMAGIVWYGAIQGNAINDYIKYAIDGKDYIDLEKTDGKFYRIDTSEDFDNYHMLWGYYSMRCFNSTVNSSIIEFYNSLDLERAVSTRIQPVYYHLRGLLSVEYYIRDMDFLNSDIINIDAFGIDEDIMPGFELDHISDKYYIYKNKYYLPMGFAYDTYITHEDFDALENTFYKCAALMDSLVLTPEQYEKYSDIITKQIRPIDDSEQRYFEEIEKKQAQCCYYFKEDSNGFTAKINLDNDRLVFFSVPYSDGWSATVNRQAADIEKVSNGMMAIRVPAGEDNEIRFDYSVPYFRAGIAITACGFVLLLGYVMISRKLRNNSQSKAKSENE